MVVTNPYCPYGHAQINSNHSVTGFIEKPRCLNALCNAGIYAFNRDILHYLIERGNVEKTLFPKLAKMHCLKVYPFSGFFVTINTFRDLIKTEDELRRIYG
jgi:NDP-sugar pyrophosphorylase family protein